MQGADGVDIGQDLEYTGLSMYPEESHESLKEQVPGNDAIAHKPPVERKGIIKVKKSSRHRRLHRSDAEDQIIPQDDLGIDLDMADMDCDETDEENNGEATALEMLAEYRMQMKYANTMANKN